MNFGTLSYHADDKVISNIRERIQKQQQLRNQNTYNLTSDTTINNLQQQKNIYGTKNEYRTNNVGTKTLLNKKKQNQKAPEQNRAVLGELVNLNTSNVNAHNSSARFLRNTNNIERTIHNANNVYVDQENHKFNASTVDMHNRTYSTSNMEVDIENESVILSKETHFPEQRVISNASTSTSRSNTSTSRSNTSTLSRKEVYPLTLEYTLEDNMALQNAYKRYHTSFPDLQDSDTFDVTLCCEYQPEIFNHLRMLEEKFSPLDNFMSYQPQLTWKHRHIVLNWVVYAHDKLKLLPETLYLTVNIFDRVLSTVEVTKEKLHLVAATSIFIASKYEEINHVTTADLKTLLNNEFEDSHIFLAETFILQSLEFDLGFPGPMSFLRRISKADNYQYDRRTLAKYLLETTIMDPKLATAKPSWLAAGAYYLAMVIFENLEDYSRIEDEENLAESSYTKHRVNDSIWSLGHVYYSGYSERQIAVVASTIAHNCRNWKRAHEAIYHKYCSKKQKRCSLIVDDWLKILEEQRLQEEEV